MLLVQGSWSLISDQLWNMKSLHTILKFESGNSSVISGRTKRRKVVPAIPIGWINGGRNISHQANVGVTNGKFKLEWASRRERPEVPFSPPPSVQARLSQVLSQTDSSGKEMVEPNDGEPNSSNGIPKWKSRERPNTFLKTTSGFRDIYLPMKRLSAWTFRILGLQE